MSGDDYTGLNQRVHRPDEFTAKYPGQCYTCGLPYAAGEQITGTYYVSRSRKTHLYHGPYTHPGCAYPVGEGRRPCCWS
jgi:hypothetical protein